MHDYKEMFFKLPKVEIAKTVFNDYNTIKLEKNECKQREGQPLRISQSTFYRASTSKRK